MYSKSIIKILACFCAVDTLITGLLLSPVRLRSYSLIKQFRISITAITVRPINPRTFQIPDCPIAAKYDFMLVYKMVCAVLCT